MFVETEKTVFTKKNDYIISTFNVPSVSESCIEIRIKLYKFLFSHFLLRHPREL